MNTSFACFVPNCQNNGTNVPLLGISASPDLHVQQIPQQNLVIIGDCFPIAEERSFHGLDLTNIMDKLARDHWGRFVAIGHDPRIQSTAIYRDTSGMIPCYYGHSGGNVAIGTEASAILASLNLKPDINWSVIANFLMSPDLRVHETALHGITEVVPGEMVIIHRDETRHQLLWHPNDFIACNQSYDFDASRKLLELTLAQTMATWCRQYRNPMIAASGGLDSSIIAALAAQEGPASLIHFYTSVRHGDERRYVHSLANHIDLPVQTVPAQLDMIAPKTNRSSFRPRPSARLFTQGFDDAAASHAKAKQSAAQFNGGGGDNVLGKLHSAYSLADRYIYAGSSRALFQLALDICHATGASLPAVLQQGLKALRRRDMLIDWPRQLDFLSSRAIALKRPNIHPWLDDTKSRLPAQRQLVRSMARGTATTDYLNILGDLPTIYPLLSKPVMEACLSLPTWFSFAGGRDRAVARAAIRPFLPTLLTERVSKGAFDGLQYQLLMANHALIHDQLETGLLAAEGLLDIGRIKAARWDKNPASLKPSRILLLYETELWCRHWG